MGSQQRSGGEDELSSDIMLALVIGFYVITFIFASPGLVALSVVNLLLGGWIGTSWAGSQILVTALILSFLLYGFLESLRQRGGGRGWLITTYIAATGWFPFSYYGLKTDYFCHFIGQIEWSYPMHYFMFAMWLLLMLLLFGTGMLITGTAFILLGLQKDYSQAWAWAIFVQLLAPWVFVRWRNLDNAQHPYGTTWFVWNIVVMLVLCIFRYEFMSNWPHAILLQFFGHSDFGRE